MSTEGITCVLMSWEARMMTLDPSLQPPSAIPVCPTPSRCNYSSLLYRSSVDKEKKMEDLMNLDLRLIHKRVNILVCLEDSVDRLRLIHALLGGAM